MNLLHNAIKCTPHCGHICVRAKEHNKRVEFSSADNGIGIAEEDQARLFERFYKADKSRDRLRGGNGLGLSIAKKIVEMHQGEISVESRVGAGTTFMVRLSVK